MTVPEEDHHGIITAMLSGQLAGTMRYFADTYMYVNDSAPNSGNAHNDNLSNITHNDARFWETAVSTKLWQIVPPLLLLVGLTGNTLIVAVLRAMKFTENVALIFFFVLAFSDSTVLVVVLLRYWLLYTFDVDMRTLSETGCKIMFFMTYFSMQVSSWALVAVTVERCVVVRFSLRARALVTVRRAGLALVIILLALALVNGHLLVTQRIQDGQCGSFKGDYIYIYDEYVFVWIDIFVLCIIPFSIMFGCNVVILRDWKANVLRHEKLRLPQQQLVSSHSGSITLMLLAVNFYFLVTTIPISAYFIVDTFLKSDLETNPPMKAKMNLARTVSYLLQFTNYSLNFYLYVGRGRQFRAAFWRLYGRSVKPTWKRESRRLAITDVHDQIAPLRPSTARAQHP